MAESVIWLRESDVAELVSLPDAISALETYLPLEPKGEAINASKSLIALPGNASLHSLSSALKSQRYCGTKTWINAPAGAIASYLLFDSHSGRLLSVMEANALGSLRTAGISALATLWLAPAGDHDVVVVGAGRQAFLQVAALTNQLGLKRVRIYNRTRDRQLAFAKKIERELNIAVSTPETIESALRGATVITLVTRAKEPFVSKDMVGDNVHINALGAVLPTHAELQASVMEQADLVVVDNVENARQTSRELREFYREDGSWDAVQTLGEFIASGNQRPPRAKITIFKSVGMGLSDLAIAVKAFETAHAQRKGVAIDYPVAASFHWTENFSQRA